MSTKDNINYIKEELSSEEKFLEGSIKVEKFYKKYKTLMIIILAAFVVFIGWSSILNYLDEKSRNEANTAFNKVLENPNDAQALEVLKAKNQYLYEIATYKKAKQEGKIEQINVEYLKELTSYEKALNTADITAISSLTLNSEFLLKENAIFNKALLEAKNGNYKAAKESLAQIPENSKLNELVILLKHYLASK